MVTTYDWVEIREAAIRKFNGEYPEGPTEQQIIDAFTNDPGRVVSVIDQVAGDLKTGSSFRSCWAIVRHRLSLTPEPPEAITDAKSREKRIRQAEAWIRNAGIYIDRETELLAELFGDRGLLRDWSDKPLKDRMLALWRDQRPRGEAAEADAIRRANERVAIRHKMAAAKAAAAPKPEPEYDDDPNWHHTPEPELEVPA